MANYDIVIQMEHHTHGTRSSERNHRQRKCKLEIRRIPVPQVRLMSAHDAVHADVQREASQQAHVIQAIHKNIGERRPSSALSWHSISSERQQSCIVKLRATDCRHLTGRPTPIPPGKQPQKEWFLGFWLYPDYIINYCQDPGCTADVAYVHYLLMARTSVTIFECACGSPIHEAILKNESASVDARH